MDEEQRTAKILRFLGAKGLQGCPVCGEGSFAVGPRYLLIKEAEANVDQDQHGSSVVVPVMCGNCGHMMLFGPRMLPE